MPGEGQKPPEDRKTRRIAGNFQNTTKNKLFENVHHSRVPGPFWPKRAPDRTPITTDSCVFGRGLKNGPREPHKAEECTHTFLIGSLKIRKKTGTPKTMCFTMRNGLMTKSWNRILSNSGTPPGRQATKRYPLLRRDITHTVPLPTPYPYGIVIPTIRITSFANRNSLSVTLHYITLLETTNGKLEVTGTGST